MNVLLVMSVLVTFFFYLEEKVGRDLEKETFFIIMKQLLKFFILLLLCMVLRNLQPVLPKTVDTD